MEWNNAWCYFPHVGINGVSLQVGMANRPTRSSPPSDIVATLPTLLAAGITKETARLIAQKCPWADKGL